MKSFINPGILMMFICAGLQNGALSQTANSDSAQIAWVRHFAGPDSSDEAVALAVDGQGNTYVTGASRDGNDDYATVKYDPNGNQQWAKRYDGAGNEDTPEAIAVDASSNVYVTGSSDGGTTIFDITTIKYNSAGVEQWARRFNNPNNSSDFGNDLAMDGFGNVHVTGGSRNDFIVIKYTPSGNEDWVATYDGPGISPGSSAQDFGRDIFLDNAGNVYVTGTSRRGSINIATVKFNAAGILQWDAHFDGPALSVDEPAKVVVDGSGNVYVAGNSRGTNTDDDIVTIKYNSAGVEQWAMRYTSASNFPDDAQDMGIDAAGNVYVTGSTNVSGNNNFVTIKYNHSGQQEWIAFYDGPPKFSDGASGLVLDNSGNIYVTGSSQSVNVSTDFLTIKYNTTGEEQWVARYAGPTFFDLAQGIALDGSNNIIVAGYTVDIGVSYWTTVKYAQVPVTSVEDERAPVPIEYSLFQNYPNPFNPSTTIRYAIPQAGFITLKIYNLLGREIATLVSQRQSAGEYSIQWNPIGLASGIYVYRLQSGDFEKVRKLILLK